MRWMITAVAAAALAGCATMPPADPISVEEMVQLAKGGPESPALVQALENRPLGFPLTYESLKKLEEEGVPAPVLDTVVAVGIDRRARAMAPRYGARYSYGYRHPYWRFHGYWWHPHGYFLHGW